MVPGQQGARQTRVLRHSPHALMAVAAAIVGGWPSGSWAQNINIYFPPGVYGYDQQLGVTVLTRAHPGYEAPGIRAGGFLISPSLNQSAFYNTNFNGTPNSATWGSTTAANVSAFSDWTRNSLGATLGVSHNQLFSFPLPRICSVRLPEKAQRCPAFGILKWATHCWRLRGAKLCLQANDLEVSIKIDAALFNENYTDWNVGIAGGYTIDENQLRAAFGSVAKVVEIQSGVISGL
jgi:Putative beta-barrel porin 2